MLYQMLVDGDVVWSGLGNRPVQSLLRTLSNIAKRDHPCLLDQGCDDLDVKWWLT